MNILIRNIIVGLTLLVILSGSAAAQIRVSAQIDTENDVYIGDTFTYYVIIEGANQAGQVDITPLEAFNPESAGNRQHSSTTNINGRVTTSVVYLITYSMSYPKAGRIEIPPVDVVIDGRTYRTNPVPVNFITPETTDRLDLEVTLSEQSCYIGQPVLMTVNFYISADIGDFRFDIPAFTSDAFYLEEPDIQNPQAREYTLGNGINVRVTQTRITYKGRNTILLSFSKILIPRRTGRIEIAPSTVSADLAVGRIQSQSPFSLFDDMLGQKQYQRFMASSEPLTLTVEPLPEQNKPAGFYGLVGKYDISATASPVEVSVGDPITLNIRIGGNNYLKPVQWPKLEQVSELANNFKIPSEKATPEIEAGYKVFTQTIRADNDKVTEIPPIPLVYFDPEQGDYVTARSDAIKLEVSPSKVLTNADLEGISIAPVNKEVEAIKEGLSANYEGLDALTNQTFSPPAALTSPGYLAIWAGPLLALIASAFAKLYTHKSPEKEARKRSRAAAGKAVSQLKSISSVEPLQRVEYLASIMKQYIGERFGKMAGSLTSNDCYEVIAEATNDAQTASDYQKIVEDCEAVRYAAVSTDIDSSKVQEAIDLIIAVEKKSK